jgi:hypothetical protein
VTGLETDAMITSHLPCFLAVHPNMRFKVKLEQLPSFQMRYPDGSGVSGKVFPPGKSLPLLTEEWRRWEKPPDPGIRDDGWYDENTRRYRTMVPLHAPVRTTFVVVGEVVWS